jgi:hypothetical protein
MLFVELHITRSTNVTEYRVRLVSSNYLWQEPSHVFTHLVGDFLHSLMYQRCGMIVVVVVVVVVDGDDDDEKVNIPCE